MQEQIIIMIIIATNVNYIIFVASINPTPVGTRQIIQLLCDLNLKKSR